MRLYTTQGYYGGGHTPCTVYAMGNTDGTTWYAVDGSVNVNCTTEEIGLGVDVEEVSDHDMFTASAPIESLEDLEREVSE